MKKYKNYTRNYVYLPLETCTGNVKDMQSIEKWKTKTYGIKTTKKVRRISIPKPRQPW